MNDFKEALKDVDPRNVITAKIFDDGKIKTKNFLVVGKDDNSLYAIRFTTKSQSENDNYMKCNYIIQDKVFYYRWNKIFKIGKEEFIYKKAKLPMNVYKEIMLTMAKKCKSYSNIDFSSVNLPLEENSIILKNEILYLVFDKVKKTNKYKIVKLERSEDSKENIYIKGSSYRICTDETDEIDINDKDYVIVASIKKKIFNFIENNNLDFGDVLSVKNSNQKIIYLTEVSGMIYYATFDQLELFTGIDKIQKNKIEGFYRKLDEDELSKIAEKLERPLSNDSYPLYSGAKEEILSSVKRIKDNN